MQSPLLSRLRGRLKPYYEQPWPLLGRHIRERWDDVCSSVAREGNPTELHALRDKYEAVVELHLRILKDILSLEEMSDDRAYFIEDLRRMIDDLQTFRDELFNRWKSEEDLYSILVERYPLSADRLTALAKKHGAPESWRTGDDDPFG